MRAEKLDLSRNIIRNNDSSFLGLDLGSRSGKAVLICGCECFAALLPTGVSIFDTADKLIRELTGFAGICLPDIAGSVCTGYGNVSLQYPGLKIRTVTEISCHARGAHALLPEADMVLDIGGQDAKVIRIDPITGNIIDFILNDRCAAGTGRFLEKASALLGMELDEFSAMSLTSVSPAEISSQCVVFAESEIISLKAKNISPSDIAAGVHLAAARRIRSLIQRVPSGSCCYFSGGVANNVGMRCAVEKLMGKMIYLPDIDSVYTGALGAAMIAMDGEKRNAGNDKKNFD